MTNTTTTRWTCERCGASVTTDPNRQPVEWQRLILVSPPKGNPNDCTTEHRDLCGTCVEALLLYLGDPKATRDNLHSWESDLRRRVKQLEGANRRLEAALKAACEVAEEGR